jgi:hypothetical protein
MERGNIFRFISHEDLPYPASVSPSFATGAAKLHHLFRSPRNGTGRGGSAGGRGGRGGGGLGFGFGG